MTPGADPAHPPPGAVRGWLLDLIAGGLIGGTLAAIAVVDFAIYRRSHSEISAG